MNVITLPTASRVTDAAIQAIADSMAPHIDAYEAGLRAARIARRQAMAAARARFLAECRRLDLAFVAAGDAARAQVGKRR